MPIANHGTKAGMSREPCVKPRRRPEKAPRRKQDERRRRQQRHENTDDAENEREASDEEQGEAGGFAFQGVGSCERGFRMARSSLGPATARSS